MSAMMDIATSIETKILAITPTLRPQWKFRVSRGQEPLANMLKDTAFDRSFRLVPATGAVIGIDYGGTAREQSKVLWLHVGYLARQKDDAVTSRKESDEEQIITALQASGLTWPDALVNIYPEPSGSTTDAARDGSNALVLMIPWRIIYDVT